MIRRSRAEDEKVVWLSGDCTIIYRTRWLSGGAERSKHRGLSCPTSQVRYAGDNVETFEAVNEATSVTVVVSLRFRF